MLLVFSFFLIALSSDSWTWLDGNDEVNIHGEYESNYYPGPRAKPAFWTHDGSTNEFYMFGGFGCTNDENCVPVEGMNGSYILEPLNDFWKYDVNSATWSLEGEVINTLGNGGTELNALSQVDSVYDYTANNWPGGRYNAAMWTWDRDEYAELYMFGGYGFKKIKGDNETGYYNTYGYYRGLWSYETIQQKWRFMAGDKYADRYSSHTNEENANSTAAPGSRAGSTTWKYGAQFFLFGGYGYGGVEGGPGRLTDLWRFNIVSRDTDQMNIPAAVWFLRKGPESWNTAGKYSTSYSDDAFPGGRENAIGWVVESNDKGFLYLFGGILYNGYATNEVWVFSVSSRQWKYVSSKIGLPVISERHSPNFWQGLSSHEDYLFIHGGFNKVSSDYDENKFQNDFWAFKTSYNQWDEILDNCCEVDGITKDGIYSTDATESYPSKRQGSATFYANGKLYIFGGEGRTDKHTDIGSLNDFWSYDLDEEYAISYLSAQFGAIYYVVLIIVIFIFIAFFGGGGILLIILLVVCIIRFKNFEYDDSDDEASEASETEKELVENLTTSSQGSESDNN